MCWPLPVPQQYGTPTLTSLTFHPSLNNNQYHTLQLISVANAVLHPVTGAAQTFRELIKDLATQKNWNQANTNEVACLAQYLKILKIKATNTIFFILRSDLPKGRKPTYLNIVVDYWPK